MREHRSPDSWLRASRDPPLYGSPTSHRFRLPLSLHRVYCGLFGPKHSSVQELQRGDLAARLRGLWIFLGGGRVGKEAERA